MKLRSSQPARTVKLTEAQLCRRDGELLHILDNWLQRANARGGEHIACRPGCAQCCVGVFAINRLDALRLQQGLNDLADIDLERAQRVLQRAAESLERTVDFFPGDLETGILDDSLEAEEIFEEYANDEPCPALDPKTLTCDLYSHRPMTCRVYGPPVRTEGGLGVCELCFTNASPEEIAAAEVPLDGEALESKLNGELDQAIGGSKTIVAFALLGA
ncbi:MAG: YkgJ family cysteine cluster protein [Candidatus Korobacteraceae bacterium]|jgi:Fe-S-cluster containining protein